jgi:pyruvate/2-oxoglutarate/acetoin dehydrogenase E1 component
MAGLKVVSYSTSADAYGLLLSSIYNDDPVLFVENLGDYGTPGAAPERGKFVPLGKAHVARAGHDVTLIAYSKMVRTALDAATELAKAGVSVEVLDLRTIAPYDTEAVLASVAKTGRAVIVHEAVRNFGVGAEIAAHLAEQLHGNLKAPIRRIGSSFNPVPFSAALEVAHLQSTRKSSQRSKSCVGNGLRARGQRRNEFTRGSRVAVLMVQRVGSRASWSPGEPCLLADYVYVAVFMYIVCRAHWTRQTGGIRRIPHIAP